MKYTLDRSTISDNGFRLYRTKVLKAIKKENRIYSDNLFNNCLEDKREFFCNLYNVTGRTYKHTIKKIFSDEHEYEKPEEIVEKFIEYFSTIGQAKNQQIGNCTGSYPINETEFSMFLKPTNIPEVKKVIDNLNAHKSAGIDGIPADVIKNCCDIFAPLLTSLINLSFSQGTFPSCLKITRVIPISKGNDKSDMNNYRPISLLSVVSKVFERIMYSRIINFLEKIHLLNDSYFVIRSKRSCVDAIAHIVEKIREDHHKTFYTCIFLLEKSFQHSGSYTITSKHLQYRYRRKNLLLAPILPAR